MNMNKWFLYPLAILIGLGVAVGAASTSLGAEFYKGKTIRIIVPWSPGGSPDIGARLYARHLGRFIPGKPKIFVQNMTGAGGLIATNYLAAAARPDGLTLGITEPPVAITELADLPGVKYKMAEFQYIGSLEQQSQVAFLRRGLPYDTLEKLLKAKKPIVAAGRRVGASDYVGAKGMEALGVPMKIVTGYNGSAEEIVALERGEVDLFITSLSTLETIRPEWLKPDGPVYPLVIIGHDLPEFAHLPNIRDLTAVPGKEGFVKITDFLGRASRRLLIAPPGTPKDVIETLREAFSHMVKDERFLAEAKRVKAEIKPLSGEEVAKGLKEFMADPVVKETAPKLMKK